MSKTYNYTGLSICAAGDDGTKAGHYFAEEIGLRAGYRPFVHSAVSRKPCIIVGTAADLKKARLLPAAAKFKLIRDGYAIWQDAIENILTIAGNDFRGCMFGCGMFLRNIDIRNADVTLIKDLTGVYNPALPIRGHQLGYRPTPNTYDAWMPEDFARYYRDLMIFGVNMVELMPGMSGDRDPDPKGLMKLPSNEMLIKTSEQADRLDIDVSIWYPNSNDETLEQCAAERKRVLCSMPRLNVVFPPGGDPGDYPADEFVQRVVATKDAMKKKHPNAEMWPSAQKPKRMPLWGQVFLEKLKELPDGVIGGVIHGPNEAMRIDALRRQLDGRYPIRLYPDITHNVRCTWPVDTPDEKWHYAFASTLGRESINPRPAEFQRIHATTWRYSVGSCSYSEGVTDDVNKIIWSDQDFFPGKPIRQTLCEYARAYMPGLDAETVADGLLAFEHNWIGAPDNNPHIERTLELWRGLLAEKPDMKGNWRFMMCMFRAICDVLVRRRYIIENSWLDEAKNYIRQDRCEEAYNVLSDSMPADYIALREELEDWGLRLFNSIGIQLDIERYGARGGSRGDVLDTIDQPITDKPYARRMLEKHRNGKGKYDVEKVKATVLRGELPQHEYYYSVARHGVQILGGKQYSTYFNFQGDSRKNNNGSLPVGLFNVYDDNEFAIPVAGLDDNRRYKLTVVYFKPRVSGYGTTVIKADDTVLYEGDGLGGYEDEAFAQLMLPESGNYIAISYDLPAGVTKNGCVKFCLSNNIMGVELSELWVRAVEN